MGESLGDAITSFKRYNYENYFGLCQKYKLNISIYSYPTNIYDIQALTNYIKLYGF